MLDKKVELILLAAGSSRRMGEEDKLLRRIHGVPLMRRTAEAALGSSVQAVHVILSSDSSEHHIALQGLNVSIVIAHDSQEGMAASLRAGVKAVSSDASAVIIAFADMPDVTSADINHLCAAFYLANGPVICRAETEDGKPGHPVLFSRSFFKTLIGLTGDRGAKEVLLESEEFIISVPTAGQAAVTDLDTPEDWKSWLDTKQQ